MLDFSKEELMRYSRNILLKEVGAEGQERLRLGRVLIVGTGGLGSPVSLYLAAAGVGTIGLIDGDCVDLSNLQRQIVHSTPDVGRMKTDSAKEKLQKLNPNINVETYPILLSAENALEIISNYDFIVDGTDNFQAKFLVNDSCVIAGKAFSHGGILRFQGQTMTHIPGSACYRCLFPDIPDPDSVPSCATAGVLGAIAGMLGSIQAAEALKYLTGAGELLTDKLLTFDALSMDFRKINIVRDSDCPVCGNHPSITKPIDYEIKNTCKI